jgi:hypothetical protein
MEYANNQKREWREEMASISEEREREIRNSRDLSLMTNNEEESTRCALYLCSILFYFVILILKNRERGKK